MKDLVSLLGINYKKLCSTLYKCSVSCCQYLIVLDIWYECIKVSAYNLVENKQTFSQIEVISLLKICVLALIRFINMIEKMRVLVHRSVLK
jgi:hypothetical protein